MRIYGSTLLLEWPCNISSKNIDYDSYLIVYEPPIGYPPTNSKFPLNRCTAKISETISATVYNVSISVIVNNGSTILISQRNVTSSPDAPILDTIITAQSDTVFSFFPSYGNDLNYQIEYYPINNAQQQSIVFETKATHIALTDLRPNTEYTLKITTKYQGIQSDDATITTFKTKGILF
uniref:Fibronectin type-III domain-containing protein n=1 Tax=Ascaris lumbricoides TaxID=6252 RepID=A0A0M3IPT5_ASCLU